MVVIFDTQFIIRQKQTDTEREWHGVGPHFARPLTSNSDSVPIRPNEIRGGIRRSLSTVRPERLRRQEI